MTIDEARIHVYNREGGRCENCDVRVPWFSAQLAHRIPQSRAMLRKYGRAVIHHPLNLALACSLECNDGLSISNHPEAERLLVIRIKAELGRPLCS